MVENSAYISLPLSIFGWLLIRANAANMWQSEPALWNSNLLILQQCRRAKGSIGTNQQPTEYRHW